MLVPPAKSHLNLHDLKKGEASSDSSCADSKNLHSWISPLLRLMHFQLATPLNCMTIQSGGLPPR
jgi:hypothetical protein